MRNPLNKQKGSNKQQPINSRKVTERARSQAEAIAALPIVRSVPLNLQQQMQMDKMGQNYNSIVEIFNPATNSWQKASSGLKVLNSMLPPDKKINIENAKRVGEKVFSGSPMPNETTLSVMNASYGLSKAPNPKPVSLNSGISPNTSSNDLMVPMLGMCAPLHMTAVKFRLPKFGTFKDYFKNTIAFDIQSRAQANVGFNLDIVSTLSATNIESAFDSVIDALQCYYYYSSILAYESDARNKNDGMTNLRKGITSQIISDLAQLGRRLEDTPCPPRVVQWMRYMNMTFLSGDSQGAPLIKIAYDYQVQDQFPATTRVATALANLTSGTNAATFALMRRAIPQWRIGKLYDVPVIPVFDKNFLTIFANLPSSVYDTAGSATRYSRSVPNSDTVIQYNSYNNRLDGIAFAMGGVYDTFLGGWVPGIAYSGQVGTQYLQRSWYTNGTTSAWTNVTGNPFLIAARQETYNRALVTDTTEQSLHLYGADKCQGVTGNAMVQTAQNVLDYLFNVQSVSSKGKLSSFNRRGNGQI